MAKGETPNWLYIATHPSDSLKAIFLRAETRVLDDFAPTNYVGIPLADAAKAVAKNRSSSASDGVPLSEWPKTARDQMKAGQIVRPDGRHPEHPNI